MKCSVCLENAPDDAGLAVIIICDRCSAARLGYATPPLPRDKVASRIREWTCEACLSEPGTARWLCRDCFAKIDTPARPVAHP